MQGSIHPQELSPSVSSPDQQSSVPHSPLEVNSEQVVSVPLDVVTTPTMLMSSDICQVEDGKLNFSLNLAVLVCTTVIIIVLVDKRIFFFLQ